LLFFLGYSLFATSSFILRSQNKRTKQKAAHKKAASGSLTTQPIDAVLELTPIVAQTAKTFIAN